MSNAHTYKICNIALTLVLTSMVAFWLVFLFEVFHRDAFYMIFLIISLYWDLLTSQQYLPRESSIVFRCCPRDFLVQDCNMLFHPYVFQDTQWIESLVMTLGNFCAFHLLEFLFCGGQSFGIFVLWNNVLLLTNMASTRALSML